MNLEGCAAPLGPVDSIHRPSLLARHAPQPGPTRRIVRASRHRALAVASALTLGLVAVVGVQPAGGDTEQVAALSLSGDIQRDLSDGSASVLVQLAPERGRYFAAYETDPATAERSAEVLVDQMGLEGSDVIAGSAVVAAEVDRAQLARLARSPMVARIEADTPLFPVLDRSTAQIGAPTAWASGYGGAGQVVAVVDSGVDASHPALAGRIVHEACFTKDSCPNGLSQQEGPGAAARCTLGATCEHGTHVAGIAVGARGPYPGVAPDAQLAAIQVFSRSDDPAECGARPVPCPRARTSDVLAALEHLYAVRGRFPLVAVNLSLSSDSSLANCDTSILADVIGRLRAGGVASIVASGNGAQVGGLGVPACITSTFSVAASYPDSDTVWQQSNYSEGLDVLAPGVGIVSPNPGGGYTATTGTSAAAPHVAGAWAIAAQRLGTRDVERISSFLKMIAVPVTNAAYGGSTRLRVDLRGVNPGVPAPQLTGSTGPGPGQCGSQQFFSRGADYTIWQCAGGDGTQHWAAVRNSAEIVLDVWAAGDVRMWVAANPLDRSESGLYVCHARTPSQRYTGVGPKNGRWEWYSAVDERGWVLAGIGVDKFFSDAIAVHHNYPNCLVERLF